MFAPTKLHHAMGHDLGVGNQVFGVKRGPTHQPACDRSCGVQTCRAMFNRIARAIVAGAFCASASCLVVVQGADGKQSKPRPPHQGLPPPRPVLPPTVYDPQPGPFIVRLDHYGRIDNGQEGVIANAVRSWSGNGLQAFQICLRSEHDAMSPKNASSALSAVAHGLRQSEAKIVVMPSGGLCGSSAPVSTRGGSYIVIMGVVSV